MNYKSGDLVKIAGNNNNHDFSMGEIVRLKHNCGGEHRVWVAEYLDGHDFWYVLESDMKPYKPTIMPQKIVITTDGKTTLARLFDGKTMVKRAEAKCAPSDTFDFGVGAELAVKRLMGVRGNPVTEPVKESEPVKLYCVKSYTPGEWITEGKTYELDADGKIRFDDGYSTDFNSIGENALMRSGLVPLVRRPAKVGEWVYIENPRKHDPYVSEGSIYKIDGVSMSLPFPYLSLRNAFGEDEYLVLDGYHGDSE